MKPCQMTDEHYALDAIQWKYLQLYGFVPEELKYIEFEVKGSRAIHGIHGEPYVIKIEACCREHARDEAAARYRFDSCIEHK